MSERGLIFLYGPPLVGKSTLGEAFARHMDVPFWDVDEIITARAGLDIEEIFREYGEAAFRRWEFDALRSLCTKKCGVVALGGGALTQPRALDLVEESGELLLLTASQDALVKRMTPNTGVRPLLGEDPEQGLERLLEKRSSHYASFSKRICVEGKPEKELIEEVEIALGRFRVTGMGRAYEVHICPGCLDEIGQAMSDGGYDGSVVVVTDDRVGELYGRRVVNALRKAGFHCSLYVFPAGERSKTVDTLREVWRHFVDIGIERGSTVVALGGGVTGDLAGFAAASFHRGIQWINIPTSLLAMVDASLGGKTGVNLPQGKNLLGAFHPPRQVWVDPEVLHTLPEKELHSGLAEVIKHGVIDDADLFTLSSKGRNGVDRQWSELISRAVGVKARVVREDPYEQGLRQILNFGHTVGHGVEHVSRYRLRHGEAVAIGMVAETYLAERLGLAPRGLSRGLADVLSEWNLPLIIPTHLPEEDIVKTVKRDKKIVRGQLRFSLPFGLGDVRHGIEVREEDWRESLRFNKEDIYG